MSFDTLGLSAELLLAVREQGYTQPTPIQQKAIPLILQGKDVMAGAQTGTGKTAGFTLPLLQRLMETRTQQRGRPIRALVLTPTRELAMQVAESVEVYGRHLPLRSTVVFGGVKINPQIDRLRRGVDVLVATPGRLLDHAGQRTLDLSQVEILVLDEADRMLDMGFIHDIRRVLALLPKNESRQNLLFSATFSSEIKALADRLLNRPELIEVARRNTAAELVEQLVHPVDKHRKRELLSQMIGRGNWRQVLVFTRTKHAANRLAEQLQQDGLSAAAIHGNKSQGARTRALSGFKNGDVRVLVATDIAARGLDIDQLPHVVNYELPNVPEDYVHRIGRTGRAGNAGEAISLVCVDEHKLLRDIERVLSREIPKLVVDGYEPDTSIAPEPIQNGRRGRGDTRSPARGAPAPQRPRSSGRASVGRASAGSARAPGARGESEREPGRRPLQEPVQQRDAAPKARHAQPRRRPGDAQPNSRHRHPVGGRGREQAALLGGGRRRED
jgi:ATP-dependent RNA helicase RhlE